MRKRDFREDLLRKTLAFAHERSSFYREKHGELLLGIQTLDDLRQLAPLTKAEFARNVWHIRTSREFPARIRISSGTSGGDGAPLSLVFTDGDELEVVAKSLPHHSSTGIRPLVLQLCSVAHGMPLSSGFPGAIMLPLAKSFHARHVLGALGMEFDFDGYERRISGIVGSLESVKLLAMIVSKARRQADASVRHVYVTGDRLTPRWRALLETSFGAAIHDIYGISEAVAAVCSACSECGAFHLPPTVIGELEGPASGPFPQPGDVGRLLVTSLAPFNVMHPLIRYDTGDLVRAAVWCDHDDDFGFEVLGRELRSPAGGPGARVYDGLVTDVLDDYSFVHHARADGATALGVSMDTGPPAFSLTRVAPRQTEAIVRVTAAPTLFPAVFEIAAAEIEERIRVEHRSRGLPLEPDSLKVRFQFGGS
jgi:hypothetical protein